MGSIRRYLAICFSTLVLFAAGCGSNPASGPVASATPTASSTFTSTPSITPTLATTSTFTPSPTLRWPLSDETPIPLIFAPITANNADKLEQIAAWGLGQPWDIVYSPDGKSLAVATTTGVHIFDLPAMKERIVLHPESGRVEKGFTFSSDGNLGVGNISEGWDRGDVFTIWDLRDGRVLGAVRMDIGVFSLEFSADSQTLTAASLVYSVRANIANLYSLDIARLAAEWTPGSIQSLEPVLKIPFKGDYIIPGVHFSSNTLAFQTSSTVSLVSTTDGKEIGLLSSAYGCGQFAFSRDGATLAAVCNNGVDVWDVTTKKRLAILPGTDMVASPDLKKIAAFSLNSKNASVSLYSLDEKSESYVLVKNLGIGYVLNHVEQLELTTHNPYLGMAAENLFSPDGSTLVLGKWANQEPYGLRGDVSIQVINTVDGSILHEVSIYQQGPETLLDTIYPVYSPDGGTFAVMTGPEITVWDPRRANSSPRCRPWPGRSTPWPTPRRESFSPIKSATLCPIKIPPVWWIRLRVSPKGISRRRWVDIADRASILSR